MTEAAFYDTWAWIERAQEDSPVGRKLRAEHATTRLHTSQITLAELAAVGSSVGTKDATQALIDAILRDHTVHELNADDYPRIIETCARLHAHPGKASLADVAQYCQALRLGVPYVTADKAFEAEPEESVPSKWRALAATARKR